MCLIIHKPVGVTVPVDLILNAIDDNPDGTGIMWRDTSGKLLDYKVMPGDWAAPGEHVAKVVNQDLATVEVGIHFRWRTHGPITPEMTHPYRLPGDRGLLMHNGVLSQFLDKDYPGSDRISDTLYYVQKHLADAPLADVADFWTKVGNHIGGNRFLVMDTKGQFLRVNPGLWSKYKGLYLSNTYSIPEKANARIAATGGRGSGKLMLSGWPRSETKAVTKTAQPGTDRALPNRLTRRERRILRDCLRVGHWGPFDRLGR